MSKKETEIEIQEADQRLENVENALNKAEQFFEDNQKGIAIGAVAILAIIAIIWAAKTQYFAPLNHEAQKEMFNAQYYFEADSFAKALNGDGVNLGFLQIIDEYSSTDAGKLAQYYAGVCYLNLGDFENAKKHLKAYSSDDETLNSMAIGLTGDAEVELGNDNAAVDLYNKAIKKGNKLTAPMFLLKLGNLYEKQGQKDKALKAYQTIKDEYPASNLASSIDKYIQSVQ